MEMRGNRLGPAAWVDAGLRTLAKSGFAILKADTLAKTLGISRGSFYWHFADVPAFHAAVLRRWREIALESIIDESGRTADRRLKVLLYRAFSAAGSDTERAVRAWATADRQARAAVDAVDVQRLRYLQKLLIEAGVPPTLAGTRARIIYWSYLGFALSASKLDHAAMKRVVTDLSLLACLEPGAFQKDARAPRAAAQRSRRQARK
jgi:AcrR family transcriptional regulator